MEWEIAERPGYLGKKRDEMTAFWNEKYGKDNWCLRYCLGDRLFNRDFALQIYEDAYYEHLKQNPDVLFWLLENARDVYDTATSNVGQMSYERQETPNNHIHDVAIRRSVWRLGQDFRGKELMHVRWTDSPGFRINPGIVPFHMPHLIEPDRRHDFETCRWDPSDDGKLKDHGKKGIWWNPGTIEDFYQRNKLLIVIPND
jgi:hypothetical protein